VAEGDERLARDEAVAEVELADGIRLRAHVPHARGSVSRPMTDVELATKFMGQALVAMSEGEARTLLATLSGLSAVADVGTVLGPLLDAARP
jgi:hypothetical protein